MVKSSTSRDAAHRPLALALGAGGTKGWAHVGVLKVLHESSVPIDMVVGASAGALIGALYAASPEPLAVERTAFSFSTPEFTEWFLRGLKVAPDGGAMSRRLWEACGRYRFDELPLPFATVAMDLSTGAPILLREGPVAAAVEASIRPPVIGRPSRIDGRRLVDGGLRTAVPTRAALELGAKTVIAVSVGSLYRLPSPVRPASLRLGGALRHSGRPAGLRNQIGFAIELISRERIEEPRPDVEIRPDMRRISAFSPWRIREAALRGEEAARAALPAIERLLAGAPTR